MDFTQDWLDNYINKMQCCYSTKVAEMINLKAIGDDSFEIVKAECMTLNLMLNAISVDIVSEACLTQSDFDYIFEQINKVCNSNCNC